MVVTWQQPQIKMITMSSKGFVFVLFLSFVCHTSALYFHIGETEKKCFIEDIPDETMVVGELLYVHIVSSWRGCLPWLKCGWSVVWYSIVNTKQWLWERRWKAGFHATNPNTNPSSSVKHPHIRTLCILAVVFAWNHIASYPIPSSCDRHNAVGLILSLSLIISAIILAWRCRCCW